jgi:hypothetical protein
MIEHQHWRGPDYCKVGVERVFDPSRKEKHWGRRRLARDR